MHSLVKINLVFESWLHMRVLIWTIENCSWFGRIHDMLSIPWLGMSSCLGPLGWTQLWHFRSTSVTISIRIRSIVHPRLLMPFWGRTVTHYNSTILFAANHSIFPVFNVLILIWRSRSINSSRPIMAFLMNLFLYRFKLLLLLISMCHGLAIVFVMLVKNWAIRVLRVCVGMMITPFIPVDLSLSGRTGIRHRNIISSGACISQRTVLWSIFWACVGIRWAASSPCVVTWKVVCRLVTTSSIALRMDLLNWIMMLLKSLLARLSHSSLQAVFFFIRVSWNSWVNSFYSILHINKRSLLSYYGLVKVICIIAPPSRVYQRI